jgi:hypothetical protein
MIDILLPVVLFVSVATFAVAIGVLVGSRRSQTLAEERYKLLRDQHDRLELLREERRMLIEELAREFKGSQQFVEETHPQEAEGLEQERQARAESARRRAEDQEQERLRLEKECRRLEEELERDRRRHSEVQQRVEQLEQERLRLEQELDRSNGGPDDGRPKAHPWWRKPALVAALVLGSLVMWLTSLAVALSLLNP